MKRAVINVPIDAVAPVTLIPGSVSGIVTTGSSLPEESDPRWITRSHAEHLSRDYPVRVEGPPLCHRVISSLASRNQVLHGKYFRNTGRILRQERTRDEAGYKFMATASLY